MRLIRSRARRDAFFTSMTAIGTVDHERWERMVERLAALAFDPAWSIAGLDGEEGQIHQAVTQAAVVCEAVGTFVALLESFGG